MPYKGRKRGGPGSAGGRAVVAKYGRGHMARIGLLGTQALLDQHGTEDMAEIGRNGYYNVMQRYGIKRPQPLQIDLPINAERQAGRKTATVVPSPDAEQLARPWRSMTVWGRSLPSSRVFFTQIK